MKEDIPDEWGQKALSCCATAAVWQFGASNKAKERQPVYVEDGVEKHSGLMVSLLPIAPLHHDHTIACNTYVSKQPSVFEVWNTHAFLYRQP